MKRLITLVITLLFTSQLFAGEVVKLTNGEWPPYAGKELPHYGTSSHLVTEVFKEIGITVEYGFFPWQLGFTMGSTTDAWDGAICWAKNPERAKVYYFSEEPIIQAKNVFFHRKDLDVQFDKLEDLSSMKIGATLGYFYGEEFEKLEKAGKLNITRYPNDELCIKMLLNKKIDLFICVTEVGYSIISTTYSKAEQALLTNHPKAVQAENYYFLLSKKKPENVELMKKFNASLKKFKESGKYDTFFE